MVAVATVKEAKEAMSGHFDGAVIDFMLENTTGDAALKELRAISPGLPAVLCSGYISQAIQDQMRDFSEAVHKPFKRAELVEAVERSFTVGRNTREG